MSFLDVPLLHVLLHINPAIDRRIIYNDFRSNPYLHFGAGLVPRALGVQLGEFYLFVYSFTVFCGMLPLYILFCICC